MAQVSTAGGVSFGSHFMDDPREASRLSREVDPEQWIEKYLTRLLPWDGNVLEVGCGPGIIAGAAARERPRSTVTGVDSSRARFARSAADLPRNLILRQADAAELPFANGGTKPAIDADRIAASTPD